MSLFERGDDASDSEETARRCRLLASVVAASHDAIVSSDIDGTITSWNPAAERLFGYTSAEAVGKNVRMLFPPATAAQEFANIVDILQGGAVVAERETTRVRKNGELVHVLITVTPVKDEHGRVVGAAKVAHDLTSRRQAQTALRHTEEQLRHAQRMEAVGALAGSVAHDFNNLLSVILSYGETMAEDLPAGDPNLAAVAEIVEAGRRGADLTRHLLAFSRKQVVEPRVIDLSDCIRQMERMLRRLVGEHIALETLLAPDAGKIHADPGQIGQVLMNLVVNSRDAMPDGGTLRIETAALDADQVKLVVRDDGTGMDARTLERAFEPFFTTKDTGRGTGLGLSTVYGIVKQCGGRVTIESAPGRGTAIEIRLPRTHERVARTASPAPVAHGAGDHRTILLVEDDAGVRAAAARILRREGYVVLEGTNGVDGAKVAERHADPIHLLVTDLVMPQMSGRCLADRLRAERPGLRVLFMSGYTDAPNAPALAADTAYLQKPITPSTLVEKVRGVLA